MGAIASPVHWEWIDLFQIGHSHWDLIQGFMGWAKFLLNMRICHVSTGQSISVSWWLPPFWRHSLLIQSINRIHPFCKHGREQNAWWEEIGWTLWCLCIQINWSLHSKYICDTWMHVSNQSVYLNYVDGLSSGPSKRLNVVNSSLFWIKKKIVVLPCLS